MGQRRWCRSLRRLEMVRPSPHAPRDSLGRGRSREDASRRQRWQRTRLYCGGAGWGWDKGVRVWGVHRDAVAHRFFTAAASSGKRGGWRCSPGLDPTRGGGTATSGAQDHGPRASELLRLGARTIMRCTQRPGYPDGRGSKRSTDSGGHPSFCRGKDCLEP